MSDNKNYVPSVIPAGNVKAKINSIELKDKPWKDKNTGGTITDVVLNLETEPMAGSFKGLKKDYNNPNSDTYLGQVAKVRLSEWGFKDTNLPDFQITREADILRALKSLFIETGTLDWFKAQDAKFDTKDIQRLIDLFNQEQPMRNFYMYYCLASRQYVNKNGYKTDDLYLPKWNKDAGSPFSTKLDNLIKFDIAKHVTAPKTQEVKSFEPDNNAGTQTKAFEPTAEKEAVKSEVTGEAVKTGSTTQSEEDLIWEKKAAEVKQTGATDPAFENFMNAGKANAAVDQNKVETEGTGIVSSGSNEKLPWD